MYYIPHICHLYHQYIWREICHVEKFQISKCDRYGEIWSFSTYGEISNISTSQMWTNLKFLHLLHVCAMHTVHTWYLSRTHGRCPWRKNLSCGEISNFCTWQMWRNLKFLHMWINFTFHHMTDVKKSEISFIMCTIYGILLHFTLFCCKQLFFLRFTLFFAKLVCCNLLCGENFSQK